MFLRVESVPDPLDLKSSDISTDSFRVSWKPAASDVVLYRLTWTPTDGGDSEEVCFFFLRSCPEIVLLFRIR